MMYLSYSDAETIEDLPLVHCVAHAFPALDRKEYWYYIPALFDSSRGGDAGGDPSWRISRFVKEGDQIMYSAEYDTYVDGVESPYGEYDEATVKRYFVRVMREYARIHTEFKVQIDKLIAKYRMEPESH